MRVVRGAGRCEEVVARLLALAADGDIAGDDVELLAAGTP